MQIPFIGGAYTGRSRNLNAQVCQNLYPVMDQTGAKSVLALMGTPGLSLFATPGAAEVRGALVMGSYLYAVVGNTVYRVDAAATVTTMTGTLSTSAGPVWMAQNGTQLMIVDGSYGYILSGTTVALVSDADFPTPSSLTYQDGYFIVSQSASGRFYLSGSYDGTSWDATDYATAESEPDNLQAVISARRELWLLGKSSYEVWYNSGNSEFPFERISGASNKIGCIAAHSVAEKEGTLVWLDNEKTVRSTQGYAASRISTDQIEYQIGQYETISDAIGFCYAQEGHTFYVLTFPSESKTWAYDFSTGLWHTRASGILDARHRANCYALFEGLHIVGDYLNGRLYKYDLGKYTDNGDYIRRVRAAQTIHNDRKRVFHSSFEIDFESGVGLAVNDPDIGSGTDPQAILEWSDDGGHTWSNQRQVSIGAMGHYKNRARWHKLGSARERIYKVTISDPVKVVMINAHLEAEAGAT